MRPRANGDLGANRFWFYQKPRSKFFGWFGRKIWNVVGARSARLLTSAASRERYKKRARTMNPSVLDRRLRKNDESILAQTATSE